MSFAGSLTLWQRELQRFFRQRSRIAGALGTPLVFWLLLGSGVGRSISLPAQAGTTSYLEYFFPGTIVMILLFTSIFSTISIIEDRREGFLQAVLVAPVGRSTIVMGKMLGSTSLALIQGVLFLALGPFVGVAPAAIPMTIATLALVAFGLTGLGYVLAWSLDSTQGFHAIMNLFLIPMWLLSGAVFPASGAPAWLQWVIAINPLTYGVGLVRWALYGPESYAALGAPDPLLSLGVTAAFALFTFGLALRVTLKRKDR
jgi:ABC-2 type transport system permease protein